VASRWPYRECLRAAYWRRSTSFGVRYSRSRRSALRGRRANDFEHVGRGRLLLERFAQLVEQARILNGDDGLQNW
jgi:hypothetical protein